jgi:hypothetical protein
LYYQLDVGGLMGDPRPGACLIPLFGFRLEATRARIED